MLNRRNFLKTATLGSLGLNQSIRALASNSRSPDYFSLHPFIENHPEAVFIMPTNVEHKMDAEAKLRTGLDFGRSVFVPGDENGIPFTTHIPVKINLKTTGAEKFPLKDIIGTISDPYFCEGIFEGMKELGISGNQIHIRENPRGDSFGPYGILDMAERTGTDFRGKINGVVGKGLETGRDYNWTEVPNGVFFKDIPQLEPINTPNTWLMNISKFKAHGMGVTLCSKNLQGILARPFCGLCARIDSDMGQPDHVQRNALATIQKSYERHCAENIIPRWDKPGGNGGSWQEIWSHRTLDHLSVTPCSFNIIEGIYGRDGDCGNNGPHPFDDSDIDGSGVAEGVTARDFMSNLIVFGKDTIRTDIIGHYLAGHEPGNFGYFHIAVERGMSTVLDPRKIPVYLWDNGTAVLTPITDFKRTPLLTYYLQKDYNGGIEPKYHLCDELFDYNRVSGVEEPKHPEKPEVLLIYQCRKEKSSSYASIEYRLPMSGFVRLEIYEKGQLIDVPVDGFRTYGSHLAVLNMKDCGSGGFDYRLRINGYDHNGTVVL